MRGNEHRESLPVLGRPNRQPNPQRTAAVTAGPDDGESALHVDAFRRVTEPGCAYHPGRTHPCATFAVTHHRPVPSLAGDASLLFGAAACGERQRFRRLRPWRLRHHRGRLPPTASRASPTSPGKTHRRADRHHRRDLRQREQARRRRGQVVRATPTACSAPSSPATSTPSSRTSRSTPAAWPRTTAWPWSRPTRPTSSTASPSRRAATSRPSSTRPSRPCATTAPTTSSTPSTSRSTVPRPAPARTRPTSRAPDTLTGVLRHPLRPHGDGG
jgi:hypothetical protein